MLYDKDVIIELNEFCNSMYIAYRLSVTNTSNQTPMYMALLHLHSDVIDLLVAAGAKLTQHDVKMFKQFEVNRYCLRSLLTVY